MDVNIIGNIGTLDKIQNMVLQEEKEEKKTMGRRYNTLRDGIRNICEIQDAKR